MVNAGERAQKMVNGLLRGVFWSIIMAAFLVIVVQLGILTEMIGGVNIRWMAFLSPGFWTFAILLGGLNWLVNRMLCLAIEDPKPRE